MRSPGSLGLAVLAWVARAVGALAAISWGWYVVSAFRTQQFGFSPGILAVAAVFVLPAAVLPFLRLRWPVVLVGAAMVVNTAVGAAEFSASLEEAAFVRAHRNLPPGSPPVFQQRVWPFGNHHLFFLPSSGQWGSGD